MRSQGIAKTLNIFRGRDETPKYRVLDIPENEMQTITVAKETELVRPLVSGAILRNVTFNPATYNNFIALQDKLHANLAYVLIFSSALEDCRSEQSQSPGAFGADS